MSNLGITTADGVRTIRLARPDKLNAISRELTEELHAAILQADADEDVRCVVLTGSGRAFSAGGDISEQGGLSSVETFDQVSRPIGFTLHLLSGLRKPTIAAVNGLAAAGGASLVLACDIAIASSDAWFSFAWAPLGLVPDGGATHLLPRAVGVARARELTFTGRRVSAEEAERIGLIAHSVPAERFEDEVDALARKLAGLPTTALRLTRRLINESIAPRLEGAVEREAFAQALAASTEEHHSAVERFAAQD